MTVRSHRLWGPVRIESTDPQLVYTVPLGRTVIVKNVRLVEISGADVDFDVTVNGSAADDAFFWDEHLPAGKIVVDSTWWVLEQGDEVYVRASVADALVVWGSGAVLV